MKLDEQLVKDLFNQIDGKRHLLDLQVFDGIVKNLDIQDQKTFELFSKFIDNITNADHFFPDVDGSKCYVIVKDGKLIRLQDSPLCIYKSPSSAKQAISNFLIGRLGSSTENSDQESLRITYPTDSIEAVRAKNLFRDGKSMAKYVLQSGILKVITLGEYLNNFCNSKL